MDDRLSRPFDGNGIGPSGGIVVAAAGINELLRIWNDAGGI